MSTRPRLALAAIAIVALIAFRAARLEENMVAFVVAITLQHENCRPISDRDHKAIAEISKMLDAKQVKTDYNFFNALRAQVCISQNKIHPIAATLVTFRSCRFSFLG
jgi:hypothetical protein